MYRILVAVRLNSKYEWFSLVPDSSLVKYQFPMKVIWFSIDYHLKMSMVKTKTEVTSKSFWFCTRLNFFLFICKQQKNLYAKLKSLAIWKRKWRVFNDIVEDLFFLCFIFFKRGWVCKTKQFEVYNLRMVLWHYYIHREYVITSIK